MKIGTVLYDAAPKLRFIARAGAGVDQIDEKELERRGITLINAPEGNRDAVGEHTLGMLLCLLNKIQLANVEVRQKIWDREGNRGIEIKGKTVGIIGYGNMGKAVAKRLQGFECQVLAHDIRPVRQDGNATLVPMETIWEQADIVSYHIPLNEHNFGLVDEAYFEKFKKPIFLVNMARGEIMPLRVIRYAMERGIVRGAALDVLENEKLNTFTPEQETAFQWLAAQPNVIFTPHVGGWTFESYDRINRVLVEKVQQLLGK